MGVDLIVLLVDWSHIDATPVEERRTLLDDAAHRLFDAGESRTDRAGLIWPGPPEAGWFAGYAFHGTRGSYQPHIWAGRSWAAFRKHVDPLVRVVLDTFLSRLIWTGPDGNAVHVEGLDGDDARSPFLLACPPRTVRTLVALWHALSPHLGELREPCEAHDVSPVGRIESFADFERLIGGWGDALTEARRRGWGVLGLAG